MAQELITSGRRRKFVLPGPEDSLTTIAERLFPGDAEGPSRLLSWNLHLAVRRAPIGPPDAVLGTDIVYVEPPQP